MRILVEKTDAGIHIQASNEYYVVEDVLQRASIDIEIQNDSPVVEICVTDQNFGDWLGGPELDFFDIFEVKMSKEKDKLLQAIQLVEKMLDSTTELIMFHWENPKEWNKKLSDQLKSWKFPVEEINEKSPMIGLDGEELPF